MLKLPPEKLFAAVRWCGFSWTKWTLWCCLKLVTAGFQFLCSWFCVSILLLSCVKISTVTTVLRRPSTGAAGTFCLSAARRSSASLPTAGSDTHPFCSPKAVCRRETVSDPAVKWSAGTTLASRTLAAAVLTVTRAGAVITVSCCSWCLLSLWASWRLTGLELDSWCPAERDTDRTWGVLKRPFMSSSLLTVPH